MHTLNCKGRLLVINEPIVMGIINVTPDSFYAGSRQSNLDGILACAEKMVREGATLLDIGGQSTRPGSDRLTADAELKRVIPVMEALKKAFPESFLSIDTYHAAVARESVNAGASMVNDISAGNFDETMLATVSSLKVPFVCMHLKGSALTMHQKTSYSDMVQEVLDYFINETEKCRLAGILDVILDPGIGFSKDRQSNFQLIKHLGIFQMLHKPVLLGVSRKSFIYKTLGNEPEDSLNGTTVLHTAGLLNGASILRTHDVKEAMEAIRLTRELL